MNGLINGCWKFAGCKEKIAVNEVVFWSTVSEMNLQESRIPLSKVPTPSLTFLIPFVIIKDGIQTKISSEFSNSV